MEGTLDRDGDRWQLRFVRKLDHPPENVWRALAGEQPPWSAQEHWADVHAGYVERFGAEASTIGPLAGYDGG